MIPARIVTLLGLAILLSACSRTASDYVQQGNHAFKNKHYDDAELEYRNAIKRDDKFGEAYFRLALLKLEKKETAAAYPVLRRALELLPGRDDIRVKLGDVAFGLYLESGRRSVPLQQNVQQVADALLEKDRSSYDGLRFRGYLAMTEKNPKSALEFFALARKAQPGSPEILMAQAQAYFQNDQFNEGEASALECVRTQPSFAPAYEFLYQYYSSNKRMPEAEQILAQQVKHNPKDLQARLKKAEHYTRTNNKADLERVFTELLQNPADFPNARMTIGDFYRRHGRAEEALSHYGAGRKSSSQGTTEAEYIKRMAEVHFVLRNFEEALREANDALAKNTEDSVAAQIQTRVLIASGKPEYLDQAIGLLQERIKKNPRLAELRFQLGSAYFKHEQMNEARSELLEAVKLNPNDKGQLLALTAVCKRLGAHAEVMQHASQVLRLDPADSSARLLLATGLVGSGRGNEAREELNGLLRAKPDHGAALLQLALVNIADKRYREADTILQRLYTPGASDIQVIRAIARSQIMQKQFNKAAQILQQEIKLSKQPASMRSILASLEAGAGRVENAINGLRTAIAESPNSPDIHLQLAGVYRQKKDLDAAVGVLDEAVRRFPKNSGILTEAATLNELRGERAKAMERYRQLLQIQPNNATVMNNLAFSLVDSGGDLNEAMHLAESAVRQDSKSPAFADTLAWIHFKRGDTKTAVSMLQNLTKRYPEHPHYREHLKLALLAQKN